MPPPLPAEKWAHDPIFRDAYRILRDVDAIEEAGYFDDGLDDVPCSDPKWWSAPFDKILKNQGRPWAQEASRELFVLVSTGAFCPVHTGHLEMMERAKSALEERGHVVLGGYLAPDHDTYVSSKCGAEAIPAPLRLDLCERAVCNSDWLMVERWAALHIPAAVNFTNIIERLEKYLAHYTRTHCPIQVAYVFGSDNVRFAKSFVGRGSCVCVLRPGYETELQSIRQNPRIVFSQHPTSPWASRDVRHGNMQALPKEVKQEWARLCAVNPVRDTQGPDVVSLYIRNEGDWAIQTWVDLADIDGTRVRQAYQAFSAGLLHALGEAFSRGRKLEGGPHVRIIVLDLHKQKTIFQGLAESKPIISLDPCLPGIANMEVSRCFEPLSTAEPVFVARPGADSLATQLERLLNTSYMLFDDDTFTGRTGEYVQRLVEARCTVKKFVTLCDATGPLGEEQSKYPPRLNLVDCRDFLAGAREAGLVLRLPDGSLCRAPYVLPYVRPHHRASIALTEEVDFSRDIWQLNKHFFLSLGVKMRILDMYPAFRKLCEAQGFGSSMTMEAYCDWHLEHLDASIGRNFRKS